MNHPPAAHFGRKTSDAPSQNGGHPQTTTALPEWLRDRVPDAESVRLAILAAPPALDLPELPGPFDARLCCRLKPNEVYEAFESKRDGLARGAYLRRIIGWAFAPPGPPTDDGGGT